MTPFGVAIQELRAKKGVTQKQMALAIGVSPAYLSALEHGRRGRPSFDFLQRVAGYFNIIWDEVDALFETAALSHPRVVIDTAGLQPEYTAFANTIAVKIRTLKPSTLRALQEVLEKAEIADNTGP